MDDHNEERMEEAYDEAELSDDEFEELSFDILLDRLESNDPSLTSVKISSLSTSIALTNNNDLQHRLEILGTAIGRNTQMNALMFDGGELIGEEPSQLIIEAQAVNLFRGIARSKSIKRLHFKYCDEYFEKICRDTIPLFKNNQVERIRIARCELSHEGIQLLTTSLIEFDSLKDFALTSSNIQDGPDIPQEVARELVQSLSGHSRLRKLDLSSTNVGELGCSALVDLLSNPRINLRVLDLANNNLGDEEAAALSAGMAGNVSLKQINLSNNRGITQVGWQAIFDALSTSSCRLEKLMLEYNTINDAAAQSLSGALASNTTLKTLNLRCIRDISPTGWRVLFDFLRSQTCAVENLDLRGNQLNDEVVDSLTDALASNRSLINLNLSYNRRVTGAAWQRFFSTVLANPSSGLESLDLADSADINDAAIRALTHALVNNSKLKVLILNGNYLVTNADWEMFSSVLESPHTALEELHLQGQYIHCDTATLLVNSLAGNNKMKALYFWHSDEWEPPLDVLCNSDSIMSTYNSNHILEKLGDEEDLPDEVVSLLQINRENSPSQAARIKIIKTHFNDGFVTQPFVGMDLSMLPRVMALMGRDGRAGEVDGHYFSFIKSKASLFENAN